MRGCPCICCWPAPARVFPTAPAPPLPATGALATELMWDLKKLFDPNNILNPGVILNKV